MLHPGGGGRLGGSRVDDDDARPAGVLLDPLPHDGMRDRRVRSHEDEHVRLLEVAVGERRRVEAERLLVGNSGGRHALAGVAVAVPHAHAETGEGAQVGEFLAGDLSGAEESDGLGAVSPLQVFQAVDEDAERRIPVDRLQVAVFVPEKRSAGPGRRVQMAQQLEALGAGLAAVDRIVRGRVTLGGRPSAGRTVRLHPVEQ